MAGEVKQKHPIPTNFVCVYSASVINCALTIVAYQKSKQPTYIPDRIFLEANTDPARDILGAKERIHEHYTTAVY